MDNNLLKLIVEHEIRNMTEAVYTHRPVADLIEAVAMIDYSGEDVLLDPVGCKWD